MRYDQPWMETVLELRGVTKRFDGVAVVDNVSLALGRGEFHCLLGPSGCGKTTILRMIAGFEIPANGDVMLNGQRMNDRRPYERNVTTVFQSYALFPHMTVRANVEFGLKRKGWQGIDVTVRRVLDLVQMGGFELRLPAQLSGGQRQRVALARSLALEPDVLLLDEPLAALDPALRKQVRTELKALQRRVGIAFLMVTHDQEEALSLADRITVMNTGRVEQIGSPREVYLRPASRFVANFLGGVNWVNGVGIRPEATRVSYDLPGNGARVMSAQVAAATFLGDCVHVETRLESGESLIAQVSRLGGEFQPGDRVHVWWHPGDEIAL